MDVKVQVKSNYVNIFSFIENVEYRKALQERLLLNLRNEAKKEGLGEYSAADYVCIPCGGIGTLPPDAATVAAIDFADFKATTKEVYDAKKDWSPISSAKVSRKIEQEIINQLTIEITNLFTESNIPTKGLSSLSQINKAIQKLEESRNATAAQIKARLTKLSYALLQKTKLLSQGSVQCPVCGGTGYFAIYKDELAFLKIIVEKCLDALKKEYSKMPSKIPNSVMLLDFTELLDYCKKELKDAVPASVLAIQPPAAKAEAVFAFKELVELKQKLQEEPSATFDKVIPTPDEFWRSRSKSGDFPIAAVRSAILQTIKKVLQETSRVSSQKVSSHMKDSIEVRLSGKGDSKALIRAQTTNKRNNPNGNSHKGYVYARVYSDISKDDIGPKHWKNRSNVNKWSASGGGYSNTFSTTLGNINVSLNNTSSIRYIISETFKQAFETFYPTVDLDIESYLKYFVVFRSEWKDGV